MYRYFVFLVNLWLISSNETSPKANKLINHTPVILTEKLGNFHYPGRAGLTKDQTQHYFHSKKQDGRYFCPLEPSDKNKDFRLDIEATGKLEFKYCLFKKKFKKGETPRCRKEPKPLLVEKKDSNGYMSCGSGRLYKFVYEVCVEKSPVAELRRRALLRNVIAEDVFSNVRHPHLYEVCFGNFDADVSQGTRYRTLFTKHKIRSPYILRNLILNEENNLHQYSNLYSTETYGLETLERLAKHLEAYYVQKKNEDIEIAKSQPPKLGGSSQYVHTYILQQLVPWGDFALGHWKKTTFHMINYSPMNTLMEPIWRAVNLHVYIRLIELYDEFGDVDIYTGTYSEIIENGQKIYLGNDQEIGVTIPGIWWKLLYAPNIKNRSDREGIVIIMHATGNPVPICEESGIACDPRTWEIKLPSEYFKYVYCCKVETANNYISTISQLKLKNLDTIKLMNLG